MLIKDKNIDMPGGDQAANLRKLVEKLNTEDKKETVFQEKKKVTRTIAITSGKGGVGKSSIAVNLAIALSNLNKKVVLMDADLGLANLNVLLGVIPKFNIYHVVKGHKTIQEILINVSDNLDIIAGASGYNMLANLPEDERNRMIGQFMSLSGYDYLIIDTGAGVSDNVVGFVIPADDIFVITTPEPTAITDAYGMIKSIVLAEPGKSIQLIVNRAGSSLEAKKVAEKISGITEQFLHAHVKSGGFIFDDEHVGKSVRRQKPFLVQYPGSKASSCVKVIAARLNNIDANFPEAKGGLGRFFTKMFKQEEDLA